MLKGSETLLRNLRHQISDFAVLIGSQTSERAQATTRSYGLLLQQKRNWEIEQIKLLLAGKPGDRGAVINVYTELVNTLSTVERRLADNTDYTNAIGFPDVKQMQTALNDDDVFITYVPTIGGIGRLCIAKTSVTRSFSPLDGPQVFADTKLLKLALTAEDAPEEERDSQYPVQAAIRLKAMLFDGLARCMASAAHVIVATPVDVAGIPLAALLEEAPPTLKDGYDLKQAKWLGNRFRFSTVVSARHFLGIARLQSRQAASKSYLGVGDPDLDRPVELAMAGDQRSASKASDDIYRLQQIPETAEEINAVRGLFGSRDRDVLIGKAATEEAFRSRALGGYDLIHFATHGLFKGELNNTAESALVFTPGRTDDSFDNGQLTASEITRLTINARLVVLSACNTARIDTGAASVGASDLQAAFAVAGAPTMVATLWPVDSPTARDLITGFFDNWQKRTSKSASRSLAEATRAYLDKADRAHQHPRFWAPFVVLGYGGEQSSAQSLPIASEPEYAPLNNDSGEVVDAKSIDGKMMLSLQGEWDGRSMASIVKPENDDKAAIRTHEIGAGKLIAGNQSFYVSGFRTSQNSFPVLRKIGSDMNVIWERRLDDLAGYSMSDIQVIDNSVILLAETLYVGAAEPRKLALIRIDENGREVSRASITAPSADGMIGQRSFLSNAAGSLALVVNSQAPIHFDTSRLEPFGIPALCTADVTTMLYPIDPISLKAGPAATIDNFQTVSTQIAGGTRLLGGALHESCARTAKASLIQVPPLDGANPITTTTLWTDDDPFSSKVQALVPTEKGMTILVQRERPIGVRTLQPAKLDVGSKRWGDEGNTLTEYSLMTFDQDFKPTGRSESSFGISAFPQGMTVANDNTLVLFGSLGGRPAMTLR